MKSTRKGNDLEKLAKSYLESEGYQVHRAIRTYVKPPGGRAFMRSNDVFGCFDLIALSSFSWPRFIQITTKSHASEKKAKIDEKFKKYLYGTIVEVWAWHGGKGRRYFAQYVRDVPGNWERSDLVIQME